MSKVWKNASIIDIGRSNFEFSIKLINAAKERIKNMDADAGEIEDRRQRLSKAINESSGWGLKNAQDADAPASRNKANIVYKQLTTSDLPEILSAAKISFPEFWKICYDKELISLTPEGADPDDPKYKDLDRYLPKDVSDMYRTIDGLDDKEREMVGDIAMMLTPAFWHSDTDEMLTVKRQVVDNIENLDIGPNPYLEMGPTGRIWALIRRKIKYDETMNEREDSLPRGSKARSAIQQMHSRRRSGFALDLIPVVCNVYGVSAHHIFGLPDDVKLYAEKDGTEKIITAYMFMSESNKEIFREMLRKEKEL